MGVKYEVDSMWFEQQPSIVAVIQQRQQCSLVVATCGTRLDRPPPLRRRRTTGVTAGGTPSVPPHRPPTPAVAAHFRHRGRPIGRAVRAPVLGRRAVPPNRTCRAVPGTYAGRVCRRRCRRRRLVPHFVLRRRRAAR